MFSFHITGVQSYFKKWGKRFAAICETRKAKLFFSGQTHQGIVSEQIPEREYTDVCVGKNQR